MIDLNFKIIWICLADNQQAFYHICSDSSNCCLLFDSTEANLDILQDLGSMMNQVERVIHRCWWKSIVTLENTHALTCDDQYLWCPIPCQESMPTKRFLSDTRSSLVDIWLMQMANNLNGMCSLLQGFSRAICHSKAASTGAFQLVTTQATFKQFQQAIRATGRNSLPCETPTFCSLNYDWWLFYHYHEPPLQWQSSSWMRNDTPFQSILSLTREANPIVIQTATATVKVAASWPTNEQTRRPIGLVAGHQDINWSISPLLLPISPTS